MNITSDDQHNLVYERGTGAISPHMELLGREPKLTKRVEKSVAGGIRDLDAVTEYNPENWAAY